MYRAFSYLLNTIIGAIMKPIVIRKANCGHWSVVRVYDTGTPLIYYKTIFHGSFSDVLLLLNGEAEVIEYA